MTALLDVDHRIVDHLCRRSRTGCDGACLGRHPMRRSADQQRSSSINPDIAIAVRPRIRSSGSHDLRQSQPTSAIAAPATNTKSP